MNVNGGQGGETSASALAEAASGGRADLLTWPRSAWVFLFGTVLIYAPALAFSVRHWIQDDNYAHGFFIFPVSTFLLWMRREEIRTAPRRPEGWGLGLLGLGLAIQTACYLLQIKYVGAWSLVPTLAGGVLLLHGRALWRIVQFPVWFLLFALPLPNVVLGHLTSTIQNASTVGAAEIMGALGYPLVRHGNVLMVPGATLEVAAACSGFHKMISLLAFGAIYGYLAGGPAGRGAARRLLLLLAAIPIALLTNVLRISGLVAAADYGGLATLHLAHDAAEFVAIFLAFGFFLLLGKGLGCGTIGFSPPSAAA